MEKSPLSAQEVVETVALQKDMHEKTVKTLLNHLLKKKILGFDKEKRNICIIPYSAEKHMCNLKIKNFWRIGLVTKSRINCWSVCGKGIIEQARNRGIEKTIR